MSIIGYFIVTGFMIMLGIVGWAYTYYFNQATDSNDSVRIDPLPPSRE